ncbi:MAG TPA: GDYXXLXY domain-containing protein [Chryseolinea sp.]
MKKVMLALFVVMCLAQWIVPGKMIYDSEQTISTGTIYKFKTAPIDPSDPFRGKYITLSFQDNFFQFKDTTAFQRGQQIFVTFTTDSAGFAVADSVFYAKPDSQTYLQTTVDYVDNYSGENKVWYKLPFDRFYLEESKASEAEQIYWEAQRDSAQVAYALVSIGRGQAVLQDVIINDRPVLEIVNSLNGTEQ